MMVQNKGRAAVNGHFGILERRARIKVFGHTVGLNSTYETPVCVCGTSMCHKRWLLEANYVPLNLSSDKADFTVDCVVYRESWRIETEGNTTRDEPITRKGWKLETMFVNKSYRLLKNTGNSPAHSKGHISQS